MRQRAHRQQRRAVGPMQVFEHEDDRAIAAQRLDVGDDVLHDPVAKIRVANPTMPRWCPSLRSTAGRSLLATDPTSHAADPRHRRPPQTGGSARMDVPRLQAPTPPEQGLRRSRRRTRLVLPMPASPSTINVAERPSPRPSRRRRTTAISRSRPTSAISTESVTSRLYRTTDHRPVPD